MEEAPPVSRFWSNLPSGLAMCFFGLLFFCVVLELRTRSAREELGMMRMQLGNVVPSSLRLADLERQGVSLVRLRDDLVDWTLAREEWAGPLQLIQAQVPKGLAISRVGIRGSLGGEYSQPVPWMPPRFVPRRDFRVQIEGAGDGADTAGLVADYSSRLSASRQTAECFGKLELQGIIGKSGPDNVGREFSLLAVHAEGRGL